MKFKQLLVLLSLLPTVLLAKDGCTHDYGSTYCGNIEVDRLVSNGITTMHGTKVTKHAEVNGTLVAKDVLLNTLAVNGTASVSNAEVSANAEFNGILQAKHSQFQGAIHLASNASQFDNCTTKDIVVSNTNTPQPKLTLLNTSVNGNIVFADQQGTVYVCRGSTISGQVIGGEIIETC